MVFYVRELSTALCVQGVMDFSWCYCIALADVLLGLACFLCFLAGLLLAFCFVSLWVPVVGFLAAERGVLAYVEHFHPQQHGH